MPAKSVAVDPTNERAMFRFARDQVAWDGLSRVVYRMPSGALGITVARSWDRHPGGMAGEHVFVAQTSGKTT